MKTILSAMPAYLRTSTAVMLQYRGELVLWALWGVIYPAVAMAMWSAAVEGSPSGTSIHGMDARDFAAYFLAIMIVGHVTAAWDIFEMGYLVRSGQMSPRLLRPLLPIWQNLSDNLAYKLVTLAILIPIWIGVGWIVQPRFTAAPPQLALAMVAMLIGAAVFFLWGYTVGLAAFWLTRMDAVSELWMGVSLLLGGRAAPLTIMPLPVQWLAAILPFKWAIWFPAAAMTGAMATREIVAGLGWQLFWLASGILAFRLTWRQAVRQYSAVGA